ncbi:amino acid adenylation domain-containing protein [Paenibacillus oenotherae]|uniref:Amino acid adenylation domain-containing protein n=1 Tax=Paenibacillus oenotherae TaxID=1435645 RepID=A0ABS7D1Q7_9BACL|nr:non-ribosomal peptide synthetase [Paenibacillus oenotherae]MBW7473806.1 amino acid adenylation domain-containing protein [Paenibacillus oenotherae]
MSTFKKDQVKDMYYLSPMQEGMLFHTLLNEGATYFEQLTVRIHGELDIALFEQSMNRIVDRYDVFRTTFLHEKVKRPVQVVLKQRPFTIRVEDLSGIAKEEQERQLEAFRRQDREAGFDLSRDIPTRMIVFRLAAREYEMIWSHHHILMDGWCLGIIINELFGVYASLKKGESPVLGSVYPYSDYIKWLEGQNKEEALRYWGGLLGDYEQEAALPRRESVPAGGDGHYEGTELRFSFGVELSRKLQELASSCQITLNTLFQTLWGVLLQRYNHTEDIVFGSVVSGRPSEVPGIETMVGLFINTIPVRIQASGSETFAELAAEVQRRAVQSERYDYMPLYEIQGLTALKQDLINHIVVFENYPVEKEVSGGSDEDTLGFDVGDVSMYEQTSYDLNVMVLPGEDLTVKLNYNALVYDTDRLGALEGHLRTLAEQVAADSALPVREMRLVTEEEEGQLQSFNDTACPYPSGQTIHALFEEQAARTPHAAAVVFGSQRLTYDELNGEANRMAHMLRGRGVAPGKTVGIMSGRSPEYVTAVLAVLKAGGAFVPIDPEYPADRVAYMLDNSGAELLLAGTELAGAAVPALSAGNCELLPLHRELYAGEPSHNLASSAGSGDLLYVIYTSGTTGQPKGVMLEHRNMVNLLSCVFADTAVPYSAGVLQYTTISFDVCYQEMFSALLAGGTLYLIDNETKRSVEKLAALIREHSIPVLFLPVSFLKFIFNEADYVALFPPCVEHIITAGEQLVVPELLRTYLRERGVTLHNHYGPSETHVVTTLAMGPQDEIAELPNIGRPIANTGIYIMNSGLQLQPVGIVGELFIAGDNVGRGYMGNDVLTAEKFISNPYRSGERMYRTGDLARWLPDGEVQFLGRIDHQVKIRGHRIELGEIESRLLNHAAVTEAAVLPFDDGKGGKYLCAYYAAGNALAAPELRAYMLGALPEYMVPSYFIQLPGLPLTPNGKTDRRALPEPDASLQAGADYVAPTNELEETLAAIWEEILGVARVGMADNFFTLGGHSLKAMTLISRMNKQCNAEVPLKVLFQEPTIAALARYIAGGDGQGTEHESIPQAVPSEVYPVSSAQKRMYVLSGLSAAGTGYNIPGIFMLEGDPHISRLERALHELVNRHESFRTSFHLGDDGEPVQRVHESVRFSVKVSDASGLPEEDLVPEKLAESFIQPFRLDEAPLLRAGLIKLAPNRHLLMLDMHHIIADGVSLSIVMDEFAALYRGEVLAPLRVQYKDFAVWQNGLMASETFRKKEAYWLDQLSGDLPLLDMPTDYPRPAVRSFAGHHLSMKVEPELARELERLAAREGATLYMVMLAAYYGLLYKYTGQTDIIVGTPVAGRTHSDMESMVGMFINTVALRGKPDGGKTFRTLLQEVKALTLQAFEHQDYPFEELPAKLNAARDLGRNPLFDVLFMVQNMAGGAKDPQGLELAPCEFENNVSKFDLTLMAEPSDEGLTLGVEYCTALFKKDTMERLLRYYTELLRNIAARPDLALADIGLLPAEDRALLLEQFNDTAAAFPAERTIPELFAEQAARVPDATAVKLGEELLTYAELNAEAERMAEELRRANVGAESIVGVMMERSVEMIVSMLAILKAGGAYLPIDIDYPADRIRYIAEDSGTRLIVTGRREREKVRSLLGPAMALFVYEDGAAEGVVEGTVTHDRASASSADLAYVIYTSGTTGLPKGTMLEHRGLANLQVYFRDSYGITEGDRIAQFASSSFDASIWETFMALLTGASLHLVPKAALNDYGSFEAFMNEERITVITLPPTFVVHLEPERLPHLRRLITAGSATTRELVQRWLGRVVYVNAYGPTETTICATACEVEESMLNGSGSVPIGRPLPNTAIYIVGRDNGLQPIGVPGELCVGGAGLARGYLNRPELTAEKFVPCPFADGERMYRTGDLARWLPDGSIEYMGRIDHQVKIRGYRIELGEIEASMLKHEAVVEAIALAQHNGQGEAYLSAYYTAEGDIEPSLMRQHLAALLPGFMIPAQLIRVGSMPLTSNGKIDRRALLELADPDQGEGSAYVPPRSATEQKLAAIWGELLGAERVGIHDDFFRLGGHSLKAMSLIARIAQAFDVKLELGELFQRPTLGALASAIDLAERESAAAIVPLPEQPHYAVSAAQRRMYIMHQFEGSGTGYNMPGAMIIEGELDSERLQNAFRTIVRRHEAFRTTFASVGGEPVQIIHEEVPFEISYRVAEEADIDNILREFVRPFDLESAPLLRIGLAMLERNRYVLMFDMHHIISDGVSMGIMIGEFAELYGGRELPELTVQYKDFAAWQNGLFASGEYGRMEAYWCGQFADGVPQLTLPTDYPRPEKRSFEGDSITFAGDSALKQALYKLAEDTGTTLFMVLLAAYNVLLSKYAGQEDIVIGAPVAGRPHADLEHVMGMFVNTLALRNFPQGEMTFSAFLADVKERTLGAFQYQDYPLEQLTAKLGLQRDLSRNPLFDTVFSLQNIQNDAEEIDGLQFMPYESGSSIAKFDLTLSAVEEDEGFRFCFEYATSLFKRETVDRLAQDFLKVLEAAAKDHSVCIADIAMIEAGHLDNVLDEDMQFHF